MFESAMRLQVTCRRHGLLVFTDQSRGCVVGCRQWEAIPRRVRIIIMVELGAARTSGALVRITSRPNVYASPSPLSRSIHGTSDPEGSRRLPLDMMCSKQGRLCLAPQTQCHASHAAASPGLHAFTAAGRRSRFRVAALLLSRLARSWRMLSFFRRCP